MGADFREADLRTLPDARTSQMLVFKALTVVPGERCLQQCRLLTIWRLSAVLIGTIL